MPASTAISPNDQPAPSDRPKLPGGVGSPIPKCSYAICPTGLPFLYRLNPSMRRVASSQLPGFGVPPLRRGRGSTQDPPRPSPSPRRRPSFCRIRMLIPFSRRRSSEGAEKFKKCIWVAIGKSASQQLGPSAGCRLRASISYCRRRTSSPRRAYAAASRMSVATTSMECFRSPLLLRRDFPAAA